jgi:hypothetical protein
VGGRRTIEFGLDERAARDWLANQQPPAVSKLEGQIDKLRRQVARLTRKLQKLEAERLRRDTGACEGDTIEWIAGGNWQRGKVLETLPDGFYVERIRGDGSPGARQFVCAFREPKKVA